MGTDITEVKLLAALLSGAKLTQERGEWVFHPGFNQTSHGTKLSSIAGRCHERGFFLFRSGYWEVSDHARQLLAGMEID